ncbi:hypothetical protein D3C71_2042510 [compost metagenome]
MAIGDEDRRQAEADHFVEGVVAGRRDRKVEGAEILAERIATQIFHPWPVVERLRPVHPLGDADLQVRHVPQY